jgi:response regulator of citrate/malate metabolism
MSQNPKNATDSGIHISLDVPAHNPEIFGNNAIDNILYFLCQNREDRFTITDVGDKVEASKSSVSRAADLLVENDLVT